MVDKAKATSTEPGGRRRVGGAPAPKPDSEAPADKGAMENKTAGPAKGSGVEVTTLGEQEMNLPLGLAAPDGSLSKSFGIKPWRMTEEKELAQAKKDDPAQNLATYVSTVVTYMCTHLGHHDFASGGKNGEPMDMAERRVVTSQMYMGDVWYVYTTIRRESLGDILKLKLTCPRCRKSFPWAGSLASLGVNVAASVEDCLWEYELANPVAIRGKTVSKFRMGPQRWQVAETVYGDPNEAQAKEAALRASIYHLNDDAERIQLSSGDLDLLTKLDIEQISNVIDEHFIGPNMAIEINKENPCEHCGYKEPRLIPIDWSFERFFSISSL